MTFTAAESKQLIKLMLIMLDCRERDLKVLGNVKYDWDKIIADSVNLNKPLEALSFTDLLEATFVYGLNQLTNEITNQTNILISKKSNNLLNVSDYEKLSDCKKLNPHLDILLDYSHVYPSAKLFNHVEEYQKYFSNELKHFEQMTGLPVNILDEAYRIAVDF